mgnify:CR=1 FL=1
MLDEDPLHCLIADYAFALSHAGTRVFPAFGVGGGPQTHARYVELAKRLGARGVVETPYADTVFSRMVARGGWGMAATDSTAPSTNPVAREAMAPELFTLFQNRPSRKTAAMGGEM